MQNKNKDKQAYILMAVFLTAFMVVVATKAYQRPFMPGGPLYEPKAKIEVQSPSLAPQTAPTPIELPKTPATMVASWYDYTLNGIEWSKAHRTCASRTLKRYTMARVTNLATGASVDCFVNDFIEHPERDIDLSSYAFKQIADLKIGLVKVKIEQL